jgi:hypothetical protein
VLLQANEHLLSAQVGVACVTCVVHALLQLPQLLRSPVVSTHVDPHCVGALDGQLEAHE